MNSSHQKSPFRWFLLLWLGVVYLQSLQAALQTLDPDPKMPLSGGGSGPQLELVVFTILMVCHGGLSWMAFSLRKDREVLLALLAQGILVLLIFFLVHMEDAIFGLCLALTIEAIVLLKQTLLILLIGGGCLLLFAVTEGAQIVPVIGTGSLNKWLGAILGSLTLILFVLACVLLYIQQSRAHRQDQALLHELETAHSELKKTHRRLEEYAIQVEDLTLIAERQRLARELHDTLAQGLIGMTMQLETIDALLLRKQEQHARAIVQQAMTRARITLTEARSVIEDLRSETREMPNFQQAVQHEIHRFTAATGIPCTCSLPETLRFSAPVHEHLLRVVTEGLLNTARHAQATHVWVCARSTQEWLIFEIGDDGIGFDPEAAVQQAGHYGLLGLRERARLLQGHLVISSIPGQGTTVRIQLPGREREAR